MFENNRIVVGAIEFGSRKIRVLIGDSPGNGHVSVIGRGEAPADGVVKGEIANMDLVFDRLGSALNEADASSGGKLNDCALFVLPVSGCDIAGFTGVGTVFIKSEDKRITPEDRAEAHQNARIHPLAPDRTIINSAESYFTIDDTLRRRDPVGQTAYKLDAHVHIVHGLINRLENFRTAVRDSGYEDHVEMVFSPLAAKEGVLAGEERENGVIMIDLGAEVTDFAAEYNEGVVASGQIQVGFEHVLNDLAIGLDLPMETCRKLVEEGTLAAAIAEQKPYLDFPGSTGKVRRIPVDSFETIADLRLREIFGIVRAQAEAQTDLSALNSGAVLTGGGALYAPAQRILREALQMSVRIGSPIDVTGAATGMDDPRYSAAWGALRIADFYAHCQSGDDGRPLNRILSGLNTMMDRLLTTTRDFRDSFRF